MLKLMKRLVRLAQGDKSYRKAKHRLKAIKQHKVLAKVQDKLHCSNISLNVSSFFLGGARGQYNTYLNKIEISRSTPANLLLVDTLFHEDRHAYQNNCIAHLTIVKDNFANYIPHQVDKKLYYTQHIEKDARRYAYVQTCKYLRSRTDMSAIGRTLVLGLYRLIMRPSTGIVHKQFR